MEECESLDSEITELQGFPCEASEAISQDDEDEVEELHNSLREVVQDQSVKPKLQCLMVDPSFSMVTVQSEDSGIVWETASSRCSTPWASETSSTSEAYSMEGSGAAGKITIVFDEEKIVRRRTRSGGRSSRLGDRLSRPGSSRSGSALGVERLEMAEVSLPNVKQEKSQAEPDLEEIKNKDQQLFSLISEGYEILNIRVPSKLPTVDEEESTELRDNLSYLDQTPGIKSRNHHDWTRQQNHVLPDEGEIPVQQEPSEQDSSQPSVDTKFRHIPTQKESTSDIDYFEKFTLVDVVVPEEQAPEQQEEAEQPAVKPQVEEPKPTKETATDSLSASEDSFVFVTDVEIVGEHLDEVFYGEGAPPSTQREGDEKDGGAKMRMRRESQRSGKESGSVLFGSEETILTPIFISPGPPKIIDPILLEEPTAMSFMYSDLYEDAVGERRKSDEEYSEAESVVSEKSYKRRLSDSEEADGYLEKFILKDETPTVEVQPESVEDRREGRTVWSQSKFEMTGCLTRVVKEEDEDKTKTAEAKTQQVSVEDRSEDLKSATIEEKSEIVSETGQDREEIQLSMITEEQPVREASEESKQESELRQDQVEDQEVKNDVKSDRTVSPDRITAEPLPKTQQVDSIEEKTEPVAAEITTITETKQSCETQEEKLAQVVVEATEETAVIAPVCSELSHTTSKCEISVETTKTSLSTEAATDANAGTANEKVETEALSEALTEMKESETEIGGHDNLKSTETETSTETSLCEEKETARITETEQPCETQEVVETPSQVVVEATEETVVIAPVGSEVPQIIKKSEISVETTEKSLSQEAASDSSVGAAEEIAVSEALAKASSDMREPKSERQEILMSAEIETSGEISLCEEKEAAESVPEDVAPVEVITDCDAAVPALVELTEKGVEEREIQIQGQTDLPEVTSVKPTDAQTVAQEGEELSIETTEKSLSEEAATNANIGAVDEIAVSEALAKAVTEVKKPETEGQEIVSSNEIETSAKTSLCEEKEAAEAVTEDVAGVADVEVITDCDAGIHAEVEVTEKVLDEKEIQTQIKINLQEVTNVETTDAQTVAQEGEELSIETTEKSLSEGATNANIGAVDEIAVAEALAKALTEVKKPETEGQESLSSNEIEISAETSLCEEKEAAEAVTEDVAGVEVITDCDAGIHAEVEVTEKVLDEKEIQTQIKINLQEVTSVETIEVQTSAQKGEEHEALTEQTVVETQVPEFLTEADQETEFKTEISSEAKKPVKPEEIKTDSDEEQCKILESKQHQQEESVTDSELAKTELILDTNDKEPTEDTGTDVQKMVSVGDELFLLVPKGKAVEMDIEYNQWSEKITCDTVALSEPDSTNERVIEPETTSTFPETLQATTEEAMTELLLEVKPEVALKQEILPENELYNRYSPPVPVEDTDKEEQTMEWDVEEDEGVFSSLRSFTPREDLSKLHREDMQMDARNAEQKAELLEVEDAPDTVMVKEESVPEIDLHREDGGQKMEQYEAVAEAQEVTVEELEYEMISKQDAKDMPEAETQRDAEEPIAESGQEREEMIEMEVEMKEEKVFDLSPEEELIEDDYEIIDAEEENQARLAAELQGMDWYCLTCGCLLSEDDRLSRGHHSHEVITVDKAYEEIKEKLSDWISELQGRSENIEDLVSELELAYNSVEDQFVETEAAMQVQNEEMMALVMEQYNNMSISMEEEKKAKLEQLYDQIVSFQESIDCAKATLETTAREAETDARSPEDIHASLRTALDSALSLELGPKGLLVFEDYAKGNTSSSHLAQRKGIPVPQRPTLQPQEPGSATSTSVTVYWKVNPGDIIDCFQVYCMEDPQGAVSEEYRVTVKESYSVLEELEPDKTYKVWVMAVNYTGCSLPSERLTFRTAPSVPVIDTERCTVVWDSATLRWSSAKQTPEQSYTLEYCRQYELEGEGLRSISGIESCEHKVLLQPNENYLFYIKAVNEAGVSEQSEAALISTKGTRFHLLKASAHPALELSVDQTTLHYSPDAPENTPSTGRQCPSILGELLLAQGRYYWETIVSHSAAYRIGVAYSTANRNSPLGENSLSWCLQCIPTPSGCRYQLLHNDVQSSVFVIEMPERVGTLLDYQLGLLSFYNVQSGRLIGTFRQRFTQPCHPALALEMPGSLEVSMVLEVPEFTKDC